MFPQGDGSICCRSLHMALQGALVANQDPKPAEVLQGVRVLRAEREEMRSRLVEAQALLARQQETAKTHAAVLGQWRAMEEAVATLEDLIGGVELLAQRRKQRRVRVDLQLPDRLRESVEACALLHAELGSVQRQHQAAVAMLREEEGRKRQLAEEVERLKLGDRQLFELQRELALVARSRDQAMMQRDQIATRVGGSSAMAAAFSIDILLCRPDTLPPPGVDPGTLPKGPEVPGERALKFAELLEQKIRALEDKHRGDLGEKALEIERLKNMVREFLGVVPQSYPAMREGPGDPYAMMQLSGSAAIRAAREAVQRCKVLEERLLQSEAARREAQAAVRSKLPLTLCPQPPSLTSCLPA